ncbi:hypothetical protein PtA15_15A335 [Puccinia triticina]|uniref:protein-tyrosine-phosphatase n=1 Tax=Puccinia triticina TaxID=208348 RepID=A0ABY7D5I4_9BASI|nr:uncharacterized protein PtA15_15A335 [Puccinia triticina]WAQ91942.1 hypothetical protein PtA15_15A335 [Puccinia triticina]
MLGSNPKEVARQQASPPAALSSHRTSSVIISPKDLIALETPTWSTNSLPSPPAHSPTNRRLSKQRLRNTLTQAEISEIEQLGVKFIDPPQSPQHTNSTLSRSSSQNIHRVASSRRTSINRRKSLKTTPTSHNIKPQPISSDQLLQLISNQAQPPLLVIDLRCLNTYLGPNGRLKGSINLNFPSLLIKRFRKGVPNHFQLNPFITTEAGKRYYSKLENTLQSSSSSSVLAQLDICVIDDQLVDELPKQTSNSLGSVFLDLLAKLFAQHQRSSGLYFLNEKFENLSHNPAAQHSLLLGEPQRPQQASQGESTNPTHPPHLSQTILNTSSSTATTTTTSTSASGPQGLLRLRPSAPVRSLPSVDQSNGEPTQHQPQQQQQQQQQPGPLCSPGLSTSVGPLPSRTKPPKLRRIDTSESLLSAPRSTASLALSSKHSLGQLKIDHLSIACSPTSHHSPSPLSKLSSSHPPEESPSAEPTTCRPHVKFSDDHHDPTHDQPQPPNRPGHSSYDHSPGSPSTNPEIHFKVSTIIPSFLYLGPEPSKETDFAELDRLGIQRILNTALECVDEEELIRTRYPFIRKYFQIPLRDFVEETGVQKGIDQANRVLNDAFLHSAPTYVHCKAGKSRSVTIVLAYLIHRYRWSLKKAYAHVSERRAGICPNIGFLAELMSFEQRELMPKTHSVLGPHRANSIRPGESGLLGHLKSARSVSHHYPSSSSTSTSVSASVLSPKRIDPHSPRPHPDHQQNQHQAEEAEEEEGGHGEAFAAYSFGQKPLPTSLLRARPPPTKSYSLDLDRSHRFRVRSLAVAAKTDFFAPPPPPAQPPRDNLANLDNPLLVSPDRASPRSVFSKGPRDSLPPGFFPAATTPTRSDTAAAAAHEDSGVADSLDAPLQ